MNTCDVPLVLAPMAGVGDRAFREVCRLGGADLTYTEMISAKALTFGDKKTEELADTGFDAPIGVQLFGSSPALLASAARHFSESGRFSFVDLNMGCPVHKVVSNGEGSALLRDPKQCEKIVRETVKSSLIPVSVKIRIGWDRDHLTGVEVARRCEEAGAVRIAVHARTREDFYRDGTCRYDQVARIVESVSIPVYANGDILDGESAKRVREETGCAGLMIGRGALGKPWIFSEIRAYLSGKTAPKIDKKNLFCLHLEKAFSYKPHQAAGELRTHAMHYFKGFPGAAALREKISRASSIEEYYAILEKAPESIWY